MSKIKLKKVNEIVSEFDMQGMSNRMENGAKIQLEKKRIWSLLISDSVNDLIQKLYETKLDNSFWYHFRKMSNLFFKRVFKLFSKRMINGAIFGISCYSLLQLWEVFT